MERVAIIGVRAATLAVRGATVAVKAFSAFLPTAKIRPRERRRRSARGRR